MSISKKLYGELNGAEVYSYLLDNECGLTAEILTYGGIVRTLCFNGTDVVLGRDTLEDYLNNTGYYGALVGRNSNRIANARFNMGKNEYILAKNDGNANLHGGNEGFNKKLWHAEARDDAEPQLVLTVSSPNGEEGFPGNAEIKVTYTLTYDNALKIHYEAVCDSDSIINLTNHSYFNLNGHASGTVAEHTISLNASFYTPNTPECFPTGEVLAVNDTAFDLRGGKKLGQAFSSTERQLALFGGYDHNFALDGCGMRTGGTLTGDKTGIKMTFFTDRPAVQLYSGNMIDDKRVCKDNAIYPVHGGVCLETQAFPNFTSFAHFPGGFVKKDEKYDTTTIYAFSLDK